MLRFLLLMIACCLSGWSAGRAQTVQQPPEKSTPYDRDTTLFNRYLQKAIRLSASTPDSSHYYLQKAYTLASDRQYSIGLSRYFHFLAAQYNQNSQYDSAMQTAREEMHWALQSEDSLSMAWAYSALANVFEYKGLADSAGIFFIKELKIAEGLGNKKLSGRIRYNLSSVLYLTGDYTKGIAYGQSGYKIGRQLNNRHIMGNSLFNLAVNEVALHQYDSALFHFNRALKVVKNTADSNMVMDVLNNEGDILIKKNRYQSALSKYQKMLKLAKQYKYPDYLMYAYGNLGNTQLHVGQLSKAEKNLSKAIHIGHKIGADYELSLWYEAFSNLKEAKKDYASALTYRKKYEALNDSITNKETKKDLHKLEIKYQTAQKDKEIAQQKLSLINSRGKIYRKNIWIWIIISGLIVLIFIFILSVRSHKHKQKLQQQSLLTIQKQHEVNTLKAQMNAREEERNRIGQEMHDDVGSALTTILYLSEDLKTQTKEIGKQTADKIAATAGSVVDKMSEIIWSMNRAYDTVDDLITYSRQHTANFLENYGLKYTFEAPDPVPDIHLQSEQRRNIFLVLKESLHNVIKHAGASKVCICFYLTDNLQVVIHDDGKGINLEKLRRFGSGLQNMKQRMESVGGSFDIRNKEGTLITLECPLIT